MSDISTVPRLLISSPFSTSVYALLCMVEAVSVRKQHAYNLFSCADGFSNLVQRCTHTPNSENRNAFLLIHVSSSVTVELQPVSVAARSKA
jgi:hypothetical protein